MRIRLSDYVANFLADYNVTDTYRVVGDMSVTDRIMRQSFWLGAYPGMTDEMVDYMTQKLIDAV